MKSTRIAIILLILVLSGCGSSEEIGETMVNDTTSALTDLPAPTIEASATAILPNTPVPTTEPIHTETPDLGLQPYSTDFSEANDDWEMILSEGTTNAFRENEHYVLEATGISTTVVSSPNSILAATNLSIEVDLSFAQTEGESGEGGIICGYAAQKRIMVWESTDLDMPLFHKPITGQKCLPWYGLSSPHPMSSKIII